MLLLLIAILTLLVAIRRHIQFRRLEHFAACQTDIIKRQVTTINDHSDALDQARQLLALSNQHIVKVEVENSNVHAYNRELQQRVQRSRRPVDAFDLQAKTCLPNIAGIPITDKWGQVRTALFSEN